MSQLQIDNIIRKYQKTPQQPKHAYPQTHKKVSEKDPLLVTFMQNFTEQKSKPIPYTPTRNAHLNPELQQLLHKLDQTENKLVISERNYADVCRKYERIKQAYEVLAGDLEKERKGRMQEVMDLRNKLELVTGDADRYYVKLEGKDKAIILLKNKLEERQTQIALFQQQLQQISHKLCQTLSMRQSSHQSPSPNPTSSPNPASTLHATKSLQQYRLKYQASLSNLKAQLDRFNADLLEKEKEKKKLLDDMQELNRLHLQEMAEIKGVVERSQGVYRGWLDDAKKEKLDIIAKYQAQIQQLRKSQYLQKLSKSDTQITTTSTSSTHLQQLHQKLLQSQSTSHSLNQQLQSQSHKLQQQSIKIQSLQQQLKFLKSEYMHQIAENKKLLASCKGEQERNQVMRKRLYGLEAELELARGRLGELEVEKERLEGQIGDLVSDKQRELKSLINIKKQLSEAANSQMNINTILTQTSSSLHNKITTLQQQLHQLTTQLYAQRLSKAKLQQQLQQTKTDLKREYQLSIENTRRQLQQQMKQAYNNTNNNKSDEYEKQQMYLKMRKLERDYELLKEEIVSVDDVVKIGGRIGKYYMNLGRGKGK